MELIDVIQKMIIEHNANANLTDLAIGTVKQADPLQITLINSTLMIPSSVLYLTESVIEKKIPSTAFVDPETKCLENGRPIQSQNGYVVTNRGLQTGDKVIMLRVMGGQGFIVLSRVF